jgi:hypothetical protein
MCLLVHVRPAEPSGQNRPEVLNQKQKIMAPPRTYFVRLETLYVPLVRDPKPYRMSKNFGTLDVVTEDLQDDQVLEGTLIKDGKGGAVRPATIGDLRAGRAPEMYFSVEDPEETQTAHWRTRADVLWPPGARPMDTASFAFRRVVHAETRAGVTTILDDRPAILLHARRFREALNKTAAIANEPRESKKARIDLYRTDTPVDFQSLTVPRQTVTVSAALYVLMTPGADPALIAEGPKTYEVPAESLKWLSYSDLMERIQKIEQPQSSISSQASVCS